MGRARVHQGLPLRAPAGQGDGSRTHPVGDLDGGQADAARGRGDHERIAGLQVGDVDQGSVTGQVWHPDRGRLLPRERGGMVGHGRDRGDHQVAVDPVVVHGEGRDGADSIADLEPLAARADGGDRPGRLIPDASWEIGLFDVLAPAEHRLSAIEPQRLDADLDLAFPGRRDVEVLDLQDLGSAGLVESYYPCHGVLLLTTGVCGSSGRNRKAEWDDSSARKGGSCEGVCVGLAGSSTAATQPATSSRDANSPIMMLGALVLAEGIVGMTEASAMRRPWTPRTRSSASTTASSPDPIAQVPAGWK